MRRGLAIVGALAATLVAPTASQAYTTPTNDTGAAADANSCPVRPPDTSAANTVGPWSFNTGLMTQYQSTTSGTLGNFPGGWLTVSLSGSGVSADGPSAGVVVQIQATNGSWVSGAYLSVPPNVPEVSGTYYLPAGPLRVVDQNFYAGQDVSDSVVVAPGEDPSEITTEQSLADLCAAEYQDSAALGSQLAALDGDVKALTAEATTAAGQAHTDATSGDGAGPASDVRVTNFPTDQTVGLDTTSSGQVDGDSSALHDDLWVIVGAIVGCFALDVVLRKVWP